MSQTPVLLVVFKRPKLTELVLKVLAQVRPRTLLVAADGPRPDVPGEREACEATRELIERVDWDCTVIKNYSDVNLGCAKRPATGISWALDQFGEAIIIEDDCVPDPSFFRFCDEMLDRYRDDERIMHISGCTYRPHDLPTPYSYCFTRFHGQWGWATWRRAWQHFDLSLRSWAQLRETSWLLDVTGSARAARRWSRPFDLAYERSDQVSFWDHQWSYACWANSGLAVTPRMNLVSHLGWGADATHFSVPDSVCGLPVQEMPFPLVHPPTIVRNREADEEFLAEVVLPQQVRFSPVRAMASRVIPGVFKRGYRTTVAAAHRVRRRLS